jgi:hypothetical protein
LSITLPASVESDAGATPHCLAAAATSMARAAAPAWRMGSQLFGVAVLPPAT